MLKPNLTSGFNKAESIIAKTMEYLSIPSVVGFEQFFMDHLHEDFSKLGLDVARHPGLLEIHGTEPNSAIICAHIDRHGLISIGKKEYAYAAQYVREIKYGEEHRSSRKELLKIADRFEGEEIYSYHPKTGKRTGSGIIKASQTAMDNGDSIFFIEGINPKKNGVPLAYARTATAEKGILRGQIDNTISLGVVYALYRAGYQGTAYLTCEEEIGKSWIHISNHLEYEGIETQDLIILDTSPYLDDEPLEEGTIILRTRDRFGPFNTDLTEKLKARCVSIGIPYEVKDQIMLESGKTVDELGSTELGRLIQEKNNRWSGTTVQIPTTMYHTSYETTTYRAIRNYFSILKNILIKDPIPLRVIKNNEK